MYTLFREVADLKVFAPFSKTQLMSKRSKSWGKEFETLWKQIFPFNNSHPTPFEKSFMFWGSKCPLRMWFLITKTCLYNFDPLKPHFCIVKLGFTGVYIIFLISTKNHRLWILVRTQIMFWAEIWKKIRIFFIWKFSFFDGKIFSIFE